MDWRQPQAFRLKPEATLPLMAGALIETFCVRVASAFKAERPEFQTSHRRVVVSSLWPKAIVDRLSPAVEATRISLK
jgi:hypothetical protein